ncbi:hypothetical protein BKA60DRAFT_621503 [Fusarium oxysporum]|nr:hypothetical protein BKA60DRAFT_621503 [Fusarium oxysporum]
MTPPSPDVCKALDSVISGTQPRAPSADKINVITKGGGGICSVTGKQGTLWDPVIVAPILPVPAAWLKGEFRVEHVLIEDDQPVEGIGKADARLIGSHARFCRSIQLVNLARTIAPGLFSEPKTITYVPQQQFPVRMRSSSLGLGHAFIRPTMLLWRFFPSRICITAYELLRKLGSRLYGKDGDAQVQRLPFGLYLKYNSNPDTLRNEYNALRVLKQKTTIPAPRAFDVVSQNTGEENFGGQGGIKRWCTTCSTGLVVTVGG